MSTSNFSSISSASALPGQTSLPGQTAGAGQASGLGQADVERAKRAAEQLRGSFEDVLQGQAAAKDASSEQPATALGQSAPEDPLHDAFTDFVGQTLFGTMLATMRESVGKPAYMHGGRAEEVFQKQVDQKLVEQITDASADQIADPMYELFKLSRG